MEGAQAPLSAMAGRAPLFDPSSEALTALYTALLACYGRQPWWPAETPFEIVVGAVLTQNTAWSNVERAITRLRSRDMLSPDAVLAAEHDALADAIRPSGYFNVKARRLRSVCAFLDDAGGLQEFARHDLQAQRSGLLAVHGIGPETADDILLYALEQPVFVIDTYTRRLLQRYRLASGDEPYESLRAGFERALQGDVHTYQQYHALIVMHAKEVCRKAPVCGSCGLAADCPTGAG